MIIPFSLTIYCQPTGFINIVDSDNAPFCIHNVLFVCDILLLIFLYRRKEYMKICSEDVILGILPFFHVFGIGICLASLAHGATMVCLPRFIPNVFLQAIQTHKVSNSLSLILLRSSVHCDPQYVVLIEV